MLGRLLAQLVSHPWRAARARRAAARLREQGRGLRSSGRLDEAILHLRHAREAVPSAEGLLRELVAALIERDNTRKALAVAQEAFAASPDSHEANVCLGLALHKTHRPAAALERYEAALAMRRDDAEVLDLRGSACVELGRIDEGLRDFERAASLQPGFALAGFHRALALLLRGDFERGWDGYELRLLDPRRTAPATAAPAWGGSSLSGKTLLVTREQGLGDEIMFASIFPELLEQAGHCIVECDPRLQPIFQRSFPRATVYARAAHGAIPRPIASRVVDHAIPAGSLPRLLRRRAADFPRHDGYLRADADRVRACRERLADLGPGLKVGLSWTGGARETRRPVRSIELSRLRPILGVPGTRFVSLQYTPEAAQEAASRDIVHWQDVIDDYEQTAAMVCALDLVISVCTALVHLGGALGRPVWVMTPYSPEWRYGFHGQAMPWYPGVRLFRQPAYGEWPPVLEAIARELQLLAATTTQKP